MKIKKNINLKKYTTFKVGGPAKFFVEVKNKKDLESAVNWAKENNEQIFVMSGFQGMEDLYGIYGNVGGAVRGNAGAFAHEMADFVYQVEVYDLDKKTFQKLNKQELNFGYRTSIIKNNPNLVVWKVGLILDEASNEDIRNTKKKAFELINTRKNIHDPRPSAGSVFKNIKGEKYEEFIKANPNIDMPDIFREQKFVAAGWLVENSDLKGFKLRGAEVSDKHGNFVVNGGGAKAEDIVELVSLVKTKVRNKFGVQLQEEIQYVGFDS
jgi:UDP-N-acetylmuramate dehydrogenase